MASVVRADTSFAGIVGKSAQLRALVQGEDGVGAQRSEAHGRDVEDGCTERLATFVSTDRDAEGGRITGRHRAVRVPDELISVPVDIKLGAECPFAAFVLRPGVDQ